MGTGFIYSADDNTPKSPVAKALLAGKYDEAILAFKENVGLIQLRKGLARMKLE